MIFKQYPGATRLTFDGINDLWLFPGLGAYTIEHATEIDNLHRQWRKKEASITHYPPLYDNYSVFEDRHIDKYGFGTGLD